MLIIITAIRIPYTIRARSSETIRITWTTGEFLAATFVANAPKLYSFRHLVRRRKSMVLGNVGRSEHGARGRDLDDLETSAVSITEIAERGKAESETSTGRTKVGEEVRQEMREEASPMR